jgi:anti-anti-sigma regulatory factor
MEPYKIERAPAGPFVTVLTVSGAIQDGAQDELRTHLGNLELTSQNVVVDLTEAVLYDSWPFPLLAGEAQRFDGDGGRLVVVSGDNPTVKPFVGDASLPGLVWFSSLDDAMVELLGELAKLGEWPPPKAVAHENGAGHTE